MFKNNPKASIIIPTYNRAGIILKTLGSIQNQSYTNWECIIVDDGSTDDTENVVKKLKNKDNRFQFYSRPKHKKKGANACRNYGLELSKGDYIIWFDSDDLMHIEYIEMQIALLNKSEFNYSICKSNWVALNGKLIDGFRSNYLVSNDPINHYMQFVIFWPINAVCYKKVFLKHNCLRFDESLQQSQEYDFHVKVLLIDRNYAVLNKPLLTIVAGEDSISYAKYNTYAKIVSSIKVRQRFLDLSTTVDITHQTKLHLLNDMYRMFQQQTLERHFKASVYTALSYLRAHFKDLQITKQFFLKHLLPVILVTITYNLFGKGYYLFKKSNTFNYVKTIM